MKKIIILSVLLLVFSVISTFASTIKPVKNIGDGMHEMYYGVAEIPDNVNKTGTKGTPLSQDCTSKTNDDVGRGIARFVGGLWKVATFWYPEDESGTQAPLTTAQVK